MIIRIVKIGKLADQNYAQIVKKFEQRLRASARVESLHIKAYADNARQWKELTSKLDGLADQKQPNSGTARFICLDERGEQLSSPKLATMIRKNLENPSIKQLNFVIGGPYGLPAEMIAAGYFTWSLTPAVYPSDLAWLVVWEQVYRAFTILQGTGYHHG